MAHTYPKEYVCVMRLHGEVSDAELEWGLSQFIGEFYQTPPIRANVARQVRIRVLYEAEVVERADRDVLLRLVVSGGTYVRKLCHDLGLVLGVGGHMSELRRVRIGPKSERDATTIQQLQRALWEFRQRGDEESLRAAIKPVEDFIEYLPKIVVLDSAVDAICHGAPLAKPGVAMIEAGITPGIDVGIFTLKGELVAVGVALKSFEEMLRGEGVMVRTDRVFMARGTYPPRWRRGRPKAS
ncbi:MAG: RNA-guided pseudouridylation complex pseudouridine synthase subunit Cbf5 [Aigarchaeota archaeon]|nr:RNA-guided pseudouridylation complex pseudouridine synthase subunit Cbf5 [Candidatus Calditenuaceae archaeon]